MITVLFVESRPASAMPSPLAPLEEVARTEVSVPLASPSPGPIILPNPEAPKFIKVSVKRMGEMYFSSIFKLCTTCSSYMNVSISNFTCFLDASLNNVNIYQCNRGSECLSINFSLQPLPPRREVDEGTPMVLTVEAKGNPMPFLHWYQNGVPLQTGPKFKISQFGPYLENVAAIQPEPVKMVSELEMLGSSPSDTGMIVCVAENPYGRAETTLTLNVVPRRKIFYASLYLVVKSNLTFHLYLF